MSLATAYLDGLNRTTTCGQTRHWGCRAQRPGYCWRRLRKDQHAGSPTSRLQRATVSLCGLSPRSCTSISSISACSRLLARFLAPSFPINTWYRLIFNLRAARVFSHPISIRPYFTAVLGFRHVHPFLTDPAQLFAFSRSPTPRRKRSAAQVSDLPPPDYRYAAN